MAIEQADIPSNVVDARRSVPSGLRVLYGAIGFVLLGIGTLGVLIPGLPTVIFWLIAAYCFTRSFPAMRDWIYRRGRTGELIRSMLEDKALNAKSKTRACIAITISLALSGAALAYFNQLSLGLTVALITCCAIAYAIIWFGFKTIDASQQRDSSPRRPVSIRAHGLSVD